MKKFLMAALGGTVAGALMTTQVAAPLLAQEATKPSSVYEQLDLFGDIFERVRSDYVEEVDAAELIEAAINGMLSSLDPHSGYLPPEDYDDMRVQTRGSFGGLGIEVTQEEGFVKVVAPMDETPAAAAGIQAGDFRQIDMSIGFPTLRGCGRDDPCQDHNQNKRPAGSSSQACARNFHLRLPIRNGVPPWGAVGI